MITSQLQNIRKVLNRFTGKDREPKNEAEKYILKSMWVMLCSEFEGSLKNLVENYIDNIKKSKKIKDMHICFLLQNCYGKNKEKKEFTRGEIAGLFKRKKIKIDYANFTENKKAKYKSHHIEDLFNSLGIFFSDAELTKLKLLDGIASTRDSISHGDLGILITRKELEDNIPIVRSAYRMLKKKLK